MIEIKVFLFLLIKTGTSSSGTFEKDQNPYHGLILLMELFLLMLYALIYLIFYSQLSGRELFINDIEEEEDSGEYGLLESQV